MRIWKPSLIVGAILTLFSYSKNVSSYNGNEPSYDPWMWSSPSCQERNSSPPAQTQPPAPQDRSLETGTTDLYFDECSAVYSTVTDSPSDFVSVNAICKGETLDGMVNIDFVLKNNDTKGFTNIRGVITGFSDPTISALYPKGVTSTGCADSNCPYFMPKGVVNLEMGQSVTIPVQVSNPTLTNFTVDNIGFWGT